MAARRTIDARGALVLPGLVNAHAHSAMTMFRGLADDLDLERFLDRLLPAEGALLSEATVAAGADAGDRRVPPWRRDVGARHVLLPGGRCGRGGRGAASTCVADPCSSSSPVPTTGGSTTASRGPPTCWRRRRRAAGGCCPHSTYLLDEPQLVAIGELAAALGARVHVHACETAAELDAVRARHARTPIEVLRDTGLLGPGTVLAHGVHLDDADIALVAAAGATVTHCPASNQKLASGFAPVPALRRAGVPVALGTDGAASANDLDLWLAMRLAAYPLTAREGVGTVTAADVLAMATRNGGHAAGDPGIGTLEVGTRADIVVLDPSSPSLTPSYDPVATITYAASRADVRWVVAGGQLAVDDRRLTSLDVDAAIHTVRALGPEILAATGR